MAGGAGADERGCRDGEEGCPGIYIQVIISLDLIVLGEFVHYNF
jgi:hypothetical protein